MSPRIVRRRAGLLIIGASLLAAGAGGAGESPPWKNPPEPLTLATGIPCVYQEDASSPTTVIGIAIGGGKSAVPAGLDGLAAVSTRMLLEIPDEGKVQDLMAQATRLSYVCLEDCSVIVIECLSENLDEALRLAGKIIQEPLISGLRVGRAKELMKTSAKAAQDDPVTAARDAAFAAFFGGTGYGSALFGTEAGLKSLDRKDVLGFVRRFVVKPNVFFCVETDLEPESIRRLLERSFAGLPDGPAAGIPRDDPVLPAERDLSLERETKQICVARAFALPRSDIRDMALGDLLENLLGKGPGSRLWSLREDERLAYGVDAELTWTKSSGILIAHLETDRARGPEAGAALDRVFEALRGSAVAEEEMAATRAMARTRFLRATEAKTPRLRTFVLFETLGLGAAAAPRFLDALAGVSSEDMTAFIHRWLAPERALRVTVGPPAGEPGPGGPSCPN